MDCISPITLKTSGKNTTVPCGKCNFCLEKRRNDWSFRLEDELKMSDTAVFITLTYAEENMPWHEFGVPTLKKSDMREFTKKLFYQQSKENKGKPKNCPKLKYYLCGEYGTKSWRPHYHMIAFNLLPEVIKKLEKLWDKGFIKIGTVTQASISYVSGYVINLNQNYPEGMLKPFSSMSKGIGENYLYTNYKYHLENKQDYVRRGDIIQRLPRYYRDKIFGVKSKEEMAKKAVQHSDKQYKKQKIYRAKSNPDADKAIYDSRIKRYNEIKINKSKNDKI